MCHITFRKVLFALGIIFEKEEKRVIHTHGKHVRLGYCISLFNLRMDG